jgi:hypothetical protein
LQAGLERKEKRRDKQTAEGNSERAESKEEKEEGC